MEWILAIAAIALIGLLPRFTANQNGKARMLLSLLALVGFGVLVLFNYDSESKVFIVVIGVVLLSSGYNQFNSYRKNTPKGEPAN